MADKQKSLGKTVLSWFVVRDEDGNVQSEPPAQGATPQAGDTAIDDLIARYAGDGTARPAKSTQGPAQATTQGQARATQPGLPQPVPGQPPTPGAQATSNPMAQTLIADAPAALDLPAIYQQYGIGREEQGRVERALSLLHTLPRETPQETKRQIVEAALLAFGIQVDAILEAALLHQRALDLHAEDGAKKTQTLLEESTAHLQTLEREAERVRKIMQDQQIAQQALHLACTDNRQKVQEVLDFFGQEAVERVARGSTRLGAA